MTRFREVTVVAAIANVPTTVKGNSRLEFTVTSLTNFVADAPSAIPVMASHGTAPGERIGHVARWHLEGDTLAAVLRVTALEKTPEVGDGVSLGIDFTSRMSDTTGRKRITGFTVREVSLLGDAPGALKGAKVIAVGEVQGTHDDVPAGQLATAMKMAGMTPGFTKVTGSIDTVK